LPIEVLVDLCASTIEKREKGLEQEIPHAFSGGMSCVRGIAKSALSERSIHTGVIAEEVLHR